jgi:hypothetical protein
MDARLIDRIETNAERLAAALFGAAVGYAAFTWLSGSIVEPRLGGWTAAAAVAAFLLCSVVLERVARGQSRFRVPVFDLRQFDTSETGELLLTDKLGGELLLTEADRLAPTASVDPLLLDDVLREIGPDARVVRLFDRKAMPTPGELKSRIDDHVGQASATAAPVDASQALSDALAELRRSLR